MVKTTQRVYKRGKGSYGIGLPESVIRATGIKYNDIVEIDIQKIELPKLQEEDKKLLEDIKVFKEKKKRIIIN